MRRFKQSVLVLAAIASIASVSALPASAEKLNPDSHYRLYGRNAEGGCLTGLPFTTDTGLQFCVVVVS
jgi:hypothetical protein